MRIQKRVMLLLMFMAVPAVVWGQGFDLGEREFVNSCAACHGPDGKGGGEMVNYLTTSPPDLTQLQKNNGGVFPVQQLYGVIEGSERPNAHGSTEMPIWGKRYNAMAPEMLGEYYGAADQETFVRGRILALIEYLSTIQEN